MSDKEILDLLGLTDRTIKVGVDLEQDLQYVIENGIDKYLKEIQKKEDKKKEFIELFRECYDEIVEIMEFDPRKRVAVNCFTCIRGMDLSKQYGKPKKVSK
jgi:thermostable 8-oxoguanine DNA glycosylase